MERASTLVMVWIALLVLLGLTLGTSFAHIGVLHAVSNLGIAVLKTLLIASIFMRLLGAADVTRVIAGAGVFWLMLMVWLTLSDFLTR